MKKRPEQGEYNPYYKEYIEQVAEGDIIAVLKEQLESSTAFLLGISENQSYYRYAPGKWSVKEILGHVTDTERIMAYRLLSFARGEKEMLPGFNENDYAEHAHFDLLPFTDLTAGFRIVRQSTIHLLSGLTEEAFIRKGTANHSDVTVRALAYIIAGHELHHMQMIKKRYLEANDFPQQ